jgi:hypothetical protein
VYFFLKEGVDNSTLSDSSAKRLNPPCPPFQKGGDFKASPFVKGDRGGFDFECDKVAISVVIKKQPAV